MSADQCDGRALAVGDVVETWWGRDTIIALRRYEGTLAYLWHGEARIAEFASGPAMTIEPDMPFTRVHRGGGHA